MLVVLKEASFLTGQYQNRPGDKIVFSSLVPFPSNSAVADRFVYYHLRCIEFVFGYFEQLSQNKSNKEISCSDTRATWLFKSLYSLLAHMCFKFKLDNEHISQLFDCIEVFKGYLRQRNLCWHQDSNP